MASEKENVLFYIVDGCANYLAIAALAVKRWRDSLRRTPPVLNCMLHNAKGCPHISTPICNYPTCYLLRDYLVPSRDATELEILDATTGTLDNLVLERVR